MTVTVVDDAKVFRLRLTADDIPPRGFVYSRAMLLLRRPSGTACSRSGIGKRYGAIRFKRAEPGPDCVEVVHDRHG